MKHLLMSVLIMLWVIVSLPAIAAPDADLWPDWQAHDDSNDAIIDHSVWQMILDHHLVVVSSGVTAFDYAGAKSSSLTQLLDYLDAMQAVKIDAYNRDQQMAFWINLYNAQTVAVVMDHYPVDSIRDIDISPGLFSLGLFSSGPWDKKLLTVEGRSLSLNDIEHRILRPIWQDARIHYALNCASIGCPALAATAYDGTRIEEQLDKAALAFIQDERAVRLAEDGSEIELSSIFDWYRSDFGKSDAAFSDHLARYAGLELATWLSVHGEDLPISFYHYDWSLNDSHP
ncbi:DUF547 domain-containing protein [Thalassospira xiamenensis]|uniref:DUF547 domain-containing protein n=1 Tax=Thalassospira xiamenensis TaxID=220697 RepID=UPI000DED93CE|nr:DUF547 domain-containing protein [Thalassospira xiamenensis]RCK41396.1 hypothetical protein TH24_07660 [Thalassospira xiamenensis]